MVSSNITATSGYAATFFSNNTTSKKTESTSFDSVLKDNVESKNVQSNKSLADATNENDGATSEVKNYSEKPNKMESKDTNDTKETKTSLDEDDAAIKKFDDAMKALKKLKEEMKSKNGEYSNVPFASFAVNMNEQNVDITTVKEQVVLEKISEKFGISVDELKNITDVNLKPVDIAMDLMGIEDKMDVLTNEDLSNQVSEFTEIIADILTEVENMDVDDIGTYITEKISSVIELNAEIAETLENDEVNDDEKTFEGNVLSNKTKIIDRTLDDNVRTVSFEGKEVSKHFEKDNSKSSDNDPASNMMNNSYDANVDSVARNVAQAIEEVADDSYDSQILSQIIENVKANANVNTKSLEMQLYPEHLGKVTIQVMSKEGVLTASIVSETETAKHAMESQLTLLKENLNNQGIKVEAIEVTVESHAFEQNLQGEDRDNNETGNRQSRRRNISLMEDDDILVDETMEETKMEINGNTVSYKA